MKRQKKTPQTWTIQNNFERKNKVERICLPDFKMCYIAIGTKIIWYCQGKHIDQSNKIENLEADAHKYAQF